MTSLPRRFAYRVGRRGLLLVGLGLTWVLIGYGTMTRPPPPTPGAFHLLAPTWLTGGVWIVTGVVAVFYAWNPPPARLPRKPQDFALHRWPSLHETDALGWGALYVMPFIRVLSFGGAYAAWMLDQLLTTLSRWFGFHAENVLTGSAGAWYSMALHFPMILIVLVCSGWKEPPRGEGL